MRSLREIANALAPAVRAIAPGKTLTQAEVEIINALAELLHRREAPTKQLKALADKPAFFDHVRAHIFGGTLTAPQVEGLECLLAAIGEAGWDFAWASYGLATATWETNRTMQPVREAYWVSEGWRKANLRYYPHYGRGYVQLTWPKNYARADEELGLGGALIADLDLAMRCDIAAKVLVRGMGEGWFTSKSLADYLPGVAGLSAQFKEARRIINGTDKADEIADIAFEYQKALGAGGWS